MRQWQTDLFHPQLRIQRHCNYYTSRPSSARVCGNSHLLPTYTSVNLYLKESDYLTDVAYQAVFLLALTLGRRNWILCLVMMFKVFGLERWLRENYDDGGRQLAGMGKVHQLIFDYGVTHLQTIRKRGIHEQDPKWENTDLIV